MTIDEAIKQSEEALADKWCPWSPELKVAMQLGIEALKYIAKQRADNYMIQGHLLPGESK